MKYDMIREIRRSRKMTQEQLAELIGVKRAVVSKYETGVITPSISQLEKISVALKEPLSSFLAVKEELDEEITKRLEKVKADIEKSKSGQSDFEQRGAALEAIRGLNNTQPLIADWQKMYDGERESNISDLLGAFENLNGKGQKIAVDRVKELTMIPEYRKKH